MEEKINAEQQLNRSNKNEHVCPILLVTKTQQDLLITNNIETLRLKTKGIIIYITT